MDWSGLLAAIALAMHEATLFAAFGFLILGLGDLVVDAAWMAWVVARWRAYRRYPRACARSLPAPTRAKRIAIFVPAWGEVGIVGRMLRHMLSAFDYPSFRIFVGCYPNDPATIAEVQGIGDPRIVCIIGPAPGPSTKADCLNRIWEGMLEWEVRHGLRHEAVVLHDAEDVVHSGELGVFDVLIDRFDLVQLPVRPLVDAQSRWIAGHYIDEFAESHGKELVVREWLGAAVPAAGVGCAISRDALELLAAREGAPFDPASLTEDYELGLKLKTMQRRAAFVRLPGAPGAPIVATREHFPATLDAAVNQKARWMTGIALAGWDRMGWSGGLVERWMRLRDRQSLLAAVLLFAAYLALALWSVLYLAQSLTTWSIPPFSPGLKLLLTINLGLLVWRLVMRFGFVAHAHGWREGLRAIPRVVVANAIAMLAARRALARYATFRSGGPVPWDKTVHVFPERLPAE
jgi:bacteriophage N4 adsorption protein B